MVVRCLMKLVIFICGLFIKFVVLIRFVVLLVVMVLLFSVNVSCSLVGRLGKNGLNGILI